MQSITEHGSSLQQSPVASQHHFPSSSAMGRTRRASRSRRGRHAAQGQVMLPVFSGALDQVLTGPIIATMAVSRGSAVSNYGMQHGHQSWISGQRDDGWTRVAGVAVLLRDVGRSGCKLFPQPTACVSQCWVDEGTTQREGGELWHMKQQAYFPRRPIMSR